MTFPADVLWDLADIAATAATTAGEMIARSRPLDVSHKPTGASLASQVVTEIDRRSESIILESLAPTVETFGLGVLSEERSDDGSRLTAGAFWCVDPLDGTLPFVEGMPGYAVSIALVGRDGTPLIGVVYDPVEEMLIRATRGGGALADGRPWYPSSERSSVLSLYADRSFFAAEDHAATLAALEQVAVDLGLDGMRLGPAGGGVMNAVRVLSDAPACYLKFPAATGGGSLWDFAATACVFGELGAVATDIHGDPLDLNRQDSTFMHHRGALFASDDDLATRLRSLYAERQR